MSAELYVQETYVNATEHHMIGESDVMPAYDDTMGDLYRTLQSEYGRCTGRVYIDLVDGGVKAIGWVFVKRMQYEDADETYLREVWVTVHTAPPTKTIEYHYATQEVTN